MYNYFMLELRNIVKDYGTKENVVHALKGISLNFKETGLVCILGESGCGKTTLLNVIGGLDKYTFGDLIIDGRSTKNFSSSDWDAYRNKHIGFVFQSYNLIAHLSCLDNVSVASTVSGKSIEESNKKAKEELGKFGLEDKANKKPNQLSGGQAQRVAVARALINNPTIVLADEPTGALDSKNSVLLMELLTEVAKTRLVIVVTHNKTLAEKYANRIITISDGKVLDDTHPEEIVEHKLPVVGKKEKSGIGILTAIRLAFKSLLTKKGRTAIISIASSIGILGVGLVLALSNGFTNYINKVERDTSANMPIVVSSTQYTYKPNPNYKEYDKFPDGEDVIVYDESSTGKYISLSQTNNLTQGYVDYLDNIDNTDYKGDISSKIVNYTNLNHHIYAQSAPDTNGSVTLSQLYPYSNVSSGSVASVIASISGLPKTVLHEFYGDQNYIEQTYDVLTGTFPENNMVNGNTFQVALVLDSSNRIEANTLKKLKLYTSDEITNLIENNKTLNFNDFIGKKYAFYLNDELYDKQDSLTWTSNARTETKQTISFKNSSGETTNFDLDIPINTITQYRDPNVYDYSDLFNGKYDIYTADGSSLIRRSKPYYLEISAILRVNKDALVDYMPASLCYTNGFKEFIYEKENNASILNDTTNKIYANIDVNNLQSMFDLYNTKNVYSVLKTAGVLDSDVEVPAWASLLPDATQADFTSAFNKCASWYSPFAWYDDGTNYTPTQKALYKNDNPYSSGYQGYINEMGYLGVRFDLIDYTDVDNFINDFFDVVKAYQDGSTIKAAYLLSQLQTTLSNDKTIFPLMFVRLAAKLSNYSQITSIVMFSPNLDSKAALKNYLDAYNNGKADEEQVVYADYVGELLDQMTSIISIISTVLIVFSSISLVVSSIMSGVITYNSVIERTKEIGVYRAIGAKKSDVGKLFILENVFDGLFSGIIGIVLVYLISIPISNTIQNIYEEYAVGNICSLSYQAALILICIAIVLSVISSIIPAIVASNKDPVVALRSE